MKIIFLDIDGVLNVYYESRDEFGCTFHKCFVDNLRYVIDQTGAKIVISSTWKDSGLKIMQDMWIKRNLPGEIIDITPNCVDIVDYGICEFYDLVERGHEIQKWIDDHNIESYVILDDNDDMLISQKENFVQTAHNRDHIDCIYGYGLTKICAEKAIKILNR